MKKSLTSSQRCPDIPGMTSSFDIFSGISIDQCYIMAACVRHVFVTLLPGVFNLNSTCACA